MSKPPALHPRHAVGHSLRQVAYDILAEARAALEGPSKSDAVAIHDFRKAMKRWRALLRLLAPKLGEEAPRLRTQARDLARGLGGSRDAQSALDALSDLLEDNSQDRLSARSIETVTSRLEAIRAAMEKNQLTGRTRSELLSWVGMAEGAIPQWPLDDLPFADVAGELAEGYRRTRKLIPKKWSAATPEELHELRQRVVEHRYQMELVEPLWPRFGRTWIDEAQRLRTRLGKYQDLTLISRLAAPHGPLAPWRSRLTPLVAGRQAEHAAAAARIATRMFAESPKAFRRRLEALWDAGRGPD